MERRVKQESEPAPSFEQETRREILTKAAELFLSKGYKGVSMKEIAEAVQVTSAALYYHFPGGKEDLFARMIQTVFLEEGTLAAVDQTLAAAQDVRERFTLLTAALLKLPLDERLSSLLRDAREHLKDPESRQAILSLLDGIKRQVTHLFQAADEAGEIRTDLPVSALVSLYMGLLREAKGLPEADRAASLVSVLFDGIAGRERPSPP